MLRKCSVFYVYFCFDISEWIKSINKKTHTHTIEKQKRKTEKVNTRAQTSRYMSNECDLQVGIARHVIRYRTRLPGNLYTLH